MPWEKRQVEIFRGHKYIRCSWHCKTQILSQRRRVPLAFPWHLSPQRASQGKDLTERAELRQSLPLFLGPQTKFQCGRCPSLCSPVKGSRDFLCASQGFLPDVFYSFSRKPLSLPVQVTPASINKDLSWQNRKISPTDFPRPERNAQKM